MRKQVRTPDDEELLQRSVQGIEKKPLPHLLCVTNMLLHGIDVPTNVRHDNTLARPLASYGPKDRVNCIITNPPFGGMEEDGIETNFPQKFRTRETADLFLVLILTLLKDGGRGAIVLPDGTLFGEGVKTSVKEKLLAECNLHTIVRLPNGVFSSYTGIKTNLLFFIKGQPTKEIWYYEHPYPSGAKSYNKTKPIRIEEFDVEKAWWFGGEGEAPTKPKRAKGKKDTGAAASRTLFQEADAPAQALFTNRIETPQAWRVSIEQFKANGYNLDIKNPHDSSEAHADPDELLAEYQILMTELQKTRDRLKDELFQALEGATLDRLVTPPLPRHPACRGGLTASALLDANTTGAEAVEPPGRARWRVIQDHAHRLRNHFDRLFDTTTTIPQLRQAILQLAVQGQLVPQDPNDESADSLREKLKKARRKFWEELEVAKMEVKGVKPKDDEWKKRLTDVTPFQADDVPTLPANWQCVRVAEVGDVQLGRQRAPRYHNGPNMRPYLRVQNVYEDRIDVSDLNYMDFSPLDFVVFQLRRGDMLLNEGQSLKLVGRPAIYCDEAPGACFQNTLIRFRPYLPLEPEFALLVFRAYMHSGKFQSVAQQTTNIAHLSAGRFAELEFPLAPLSEQKRIVAKVTELLSLCDALEAKLTQAESASSRLLSAAVHSLLNSAI